MEQQHTAVVRQLTRDFTSKSSERGLRELHFAVSSTEGCTLTCGRCYRCRRRRSVVFSFAHTSGIPTRNEQVKAVKGIANTRPAETSRSKIAHSFFYLAILSFTDAEESDWATTSVVSIGKLPPKQASPGPILSVRLGRGEGGGRAGPLGSRDTLNPAAADVYQTSARVWSHLLPRCTSESLQRSSTPHNPWSGGETACRMMAPEEESCTPLLGHLAAQMLWMAVAEVRSGLAGAG